MKIPETGVWEERQKVAARTGRPVEIFSAYPLIGRGSVQHDQISHADVLSRFERALHIPLRTRIGWTLNRMLSRV